MRKLTLSVLAAAFAFTLAGCGGESSSSSQTASASAGDAAPAAEEPIVLRVGYENHPGEPFDLGCQKWKELLEQKSGGKMKTYEPVVHELYMIGDATTAGWTATAAVAMEYAGDGVFTWSGLLNSGSVKFLSTNKDYWPGYVAKGPFSAEDYVAVPADGAKGLALQYFEKEPPRKRRAAVPA